MSRGGGRHLWSAGVLVITLSSGCSGTPRVPEESGVCWRADLEMAYLGEGRALIGAFQGRWIFIGPGAIESAERLRFLRYPIFNTAQRADVDRKLRAFLATRAGAPKGLRHE